MFTAILLFVFGITAPINDAELIRVLYVTGGGYHDYTHEHDNLVPVARAYGPETDEPALIPVFADKTGHHRLKLQGPGLLTCLMPD